MNANLFNSAEAIRFDIMRLEDIIVSSKNDTIHGVKNVIVDSLKEARAAMVAAGGEMAGTATGVGEHLCPAVEPLERAMAACITAMGGLTPDVKSAGGAGFSLLDPSTWLPWWQGCWNQPLALAFLIYAVYRAPSRWERVIFFLLGFFFSPHLGGFAATAVVWRLATTTVARVRTAVRGSPCGRCCCPEATVADEVPAASRSVLADAVRRGRDAAGFETSYFEGQDIPLNDDVPSPPPVGFLSFVRELVWPSTYTPLAARAGLDVWYGK
jgi:hypothetical protein